MAYHPWAAVDLIETGLVTPKDFGWTQEEYLRNKKERDDYYNPGMVESEDTVDSKPTVRKGIGVQVPLPGPD